MNLDKIIEKQRSFVRARNWDQFHTAKNIAAALSVEAAELLEIFQWAKDDWTPGTVEQKEHLREELADVFFYLVRLADLSGVSLEKAFWSKMKKNAKKYPVRLAKGSSLKSAELLRKKKASRLSR